MSESAFFWERNVSSMFVNGFRNNSFEREHEKSKLDFRGLQEHLVSMSECRRWGSKDQSQGEKHQQAGVWLHKGSTLSGGGIQHVMELKRMKVKRHVSKKLYLKSQERHDIVKKKSYKQWSINTLFYFKVKSSVICLVLFVNIHFDVATLWNDIKVKFLFLQVKLLWWWTPGPQRVPHSKLSFEAAHRRTTCFISTFTQNRSSL